MTLLVLVLFCSCLPCLWIFGPWREGGGCVSTPNGSTHQQHKTQRTMCRGPGSITSINFDILFSVGSCRSASVGSQRGCPFQLFAQVHVALQSQYLCTVRLDENFENFSTAAILPAFLLAMKRTHSISWLHVSFVTWLHSISYQCCNKCTNLEYESQRYPGLESAARCLSKFSPPFSLKSVHTPLFRAVQYPLQNHCSMGFYAGNELDSRGSWQQTFIEDVESHRDVKFDKSYATSSPPSLKRR